MKTSRKPWLVLLSLAPLLVMLSSCGTLTDVGIRNKRAHVKSLVSVGQNYDEAIQVLRENGYGFLYSEPVQPLGGNPFISQLVIVGEVRAGPLEEWSYIMQTDIPGASKESPYVYIHANLDRVITSIK